ncbi:MAG TPA: 6-carboxytetrahydropterin synthase QueD [Caldisericia bacterium]|nr:6-carboxytetrahydropterin synthase QueD [Caldisericia bacterium]HXK52116.1 6-carboxytetrahydropterin synthase QueD [Caldisericia bacterium]
MIVQKDFRFDAAHFLTHYNGKCESLHGHTYYLSVCIEGEIDENTGMVIDFLDISSIVQQVILSKLDHSSLNDFFENPSTEYIAKWIYDSLVPHFHHTFYHLSSVHLSETPTSHVTYTKEDYARHSERN